MKHVIAVALSAALLPAVAAGNLLGGSGDEEHWPSWRGPDGTGVARGEAPLHWSDDENVRWKVPVPGRGNSTPVVWGDRMFLTTAIPAGEEPGRGDRDRMSAPRFEYAFVVLCLDRGSGEILWQRTAVETKPHEGVHHTYGSFANASPVTDGKHVWASFGSRGLYCYDLDGKLKWKRDFEVEMRMRRQFSEGAVPVLHDGTLVLVFDHEDHSFIVAVDARTGKERWRESRNEPSSWATPLIVERKRATEVVVAATKKVRSYDLRNGRVLWECAGLGTNVIPAPVRFEDTVLVMSGYKNPNLMAIELGHKGDLTGSPAVKWSTTKGLAYVPSPALHEGTLYVAMDRGFMSCFDAETGEAHYREVRLPRGTTLRASPVVAGDRLYVATEEGDVHVLRLGTELEVLATNTLQDQVFIASPVVLDGEILLRSSTHLFCIGSGGAGR